MNQMQYIRRKAERHGWLVRAPLVEGYYTYTLFPDSVHGGRDEALAEAVKYRDTLDIAIPRGRRSAEAVIADAVVITAAKRILADAERDQRNAHNANVVRAVRQSVQAVIDRYRPKQDPFKYETVVP